MRLNRVTQWFPYAVIRWWIKRGYSEHRGTLDVQNGPKNTGKFWEIFPNEVIFVGDREAYVKHKAKLEAKLRDVNRELERLERSK